MPSRPSVGSQLGAIGGRSLRRSRLHRSPAWLRVSGADPRRPHEGQGNAGVALVGLDQLFPGPRQAIFFSACQIRRRADPAFHRERPGCAPQFWPAQWPCSRLPPRFGALTSGGAAGDAEDAVAKDRWSSVGSLGINEANNYFQDFDPRQGSKSLWFCFWLWLWAVWQRSGPEPLLAAQ